MPYIKQWDRNILKPGIARIAEAMAGNGEPGQIVDRAGKMNFIFSDLIRQVYGESVKYADYNEIIGFLECAKLELYRTRIGNYEDFKAVENGPIYKTVFEKPLDNKYNKP